MESGGGGRQWWMRDVAAVATGRGAEEEKRQLPPLSADAHGATGGDRWQPRASHLFL